MFSWLSVNITISGAMAGWGRAAKRLEIDGCGGGLCGRICGRICGLADENTMSKSCLHLSDKGTYAVRFGNQNGERLKIILYNMVILVQHMDNMNGEWWGHKRNAKQKNQHNWISLAPDKPYISYSCFFFLPLLLLAHSLDIAEYFCFVPFIFYVVEHRWKYATSNWMKYGRKWKFSTLFVRVFESGW